MNNNFSFITVPRMMMDNTKIVKTASSFSEYCKAVSIITASKGENLIFRGQPDVAYKLIPKIGRINRVIENPKLEQSIFIKFKLKYQMYYHKKLGKDMDILMLAQHYGLPTRLLDWTKDSLVALYFACLSEDDKDGVVYVRTLADLEDYNDIETDVDPFQYKENFFILPEVFEARFETQNGLFEYFGNPFNATDTNNISKIIIKAQSKKKILKELERYSHGLLDLFPTLDNLCNSIYNEYL